MIVLENGDGLNVARVTGSASLEIIVSYRRISGSVFEPKRQLSTLVNDPDVDILVNSESGYSYLVESIYIRSYPGTSRFNLNYEVSGTPEATLISTILKQGESLHYDHKIGYKIINRSGAKEYTLYGSANPTITADLSQDKPNIEVINNNATPNTLQSFDPLDFKVATPIGKHYFRIYVHYTSAATNTGSRWVPRPSFTGAWGSAIYYSKYSLSSTSRTINHGLTSEDQPASSNATSASTTSNIAIIEGFIDVSVGSRDLLVACASEVASSAITGRLGSFIQVIPVD